MPRQSTSRNTSPFDAPGLSNWLLVTGISLALVIGKLWLAGNFHLEQAEDAASKGKMAAAAIHERLSREADLPGSSDETRREALRAKMASTSGSTEAQTPPPQPKAITWPAFMLLISVAAAVKYARLVLRQPSKSQVIVLLLCA